MDARGLGFGSCQPRIRGLTPRGASAEPLRPERAAPAGRLREGRVVSGFRSPRSPAAGRVLRPVRHLATPRADSARLLRWRGFPGRALKRVTVSLPGASPTQRLNPCLLRLARWRAGSLPPRVSSVYGVRKVPTSYGFIKVKYINICKGPRTMGNTTYCVQPLSEHLHRQRPAPLKGIVDARNFSSVFNRRVFAFNFSSFALLLLDEATDGV